MDIEEEKSDIFARLKQRLDEAENGVANPLAPASYAPDQADFRDIFSKAEVALKDDFEIEDECRNEARNYMRSWMQVENDSKLIRAKVENKKDWNYLTSLGGNRKELYKIPEKISTQHFGKSIRALKLLLKAPCNQQLGQDQKSTKYCKVPRTKQQVSMRMRSSPTGM